MVFIRGHYHEKIWGYQSVKQDWKLHFLESHPDLPGANEFKYFFPRGPLVNPFQVWKIPEKLGQYIMCVITQFSEDTSSYDVDLFLMNILISVAEESTHCGLVTHKSESTLAQVMACCLMAPSHYLNQCWLIISKVRWHPSESNLQEIPQPSVTEISWKISFLKFCSNLPGVNELRWIDWLYCYRP